MKILIRTLLLVWIFSSMSTQLFAKKDDKKKKQWFELMQDRTVKFSDVKNAFYEEQEKREKAEEKVREKKLRNNGTQEKDSEEEDEDGNQLFKRWEYINEFRVLPDGTRQEPDYVLKTYQNYIAEHPQLKSASGAWSMVAPYTYPVNNTSSPTGMGRINAIAFDLTDLSGNTIFIGSPSGGFWKTTDQGVSWTDLSKNMPTLGVSSILIHPTNPDIIYLGSGDRDSGDAPGMGVFKSTDGGNTWTQMNNGMGNATVGAMIMHPTDPNTIIAATSSGIYKTSNGGTTWSLKASGNFKDIKFNPGDASIVYAVKIITPSEFYRSSDTGDNWSQITSGIPTSGIGSRMVIGVSPADPSIVYLVQIKDNQQFAGLLRSTDGGLTFLTNSNSPNIMDYACDGSGTSSQADYDLCIAVDPNDANIVYVGSINNWKSTDGGVTWEINSMWSGTCTNTVKPVHADQHCLEWSPVNGNLYLGNDGGLYTTSGGGELTWTEITGPLPITQIYKIGQSKNQSDLVIYGQQDNGCNISQGSSLYTVNGGDGGECYFDYSNSNFCYDSYVLGAIRRSTTGPTGDYSDIAGAGVNGISSDESAIFITPYLLHKTDPGVMFAGYKNVWRTTSIKTTVAWSAISSGEANKCTVLEQSTADVNILYVVRSGSMKRSDNVNAEAGSVTWTACTLPGGMTPSDVKADPNDANVVYAAAGYKVYKSSNKGATWTDMSGTLPGFFINCLVIDKNANEGIYVGNQTGVWYKNADMPDWTLFSTSLPVVDIRELEIYYDATTPANNQIKAATYGRGLWKSDLAEISVIDPSNVSAFPASGSQINLSWTKNVADNNVMVAYSTSPTFGAPVNGTSYTAGNSIPGGGTVIYNGSGTSFSHSSLSPSTTYYYKAWSVNSSPAYSNGTTTINAMTDCATAYGLPFEENFSAGIMPDCWRQKDNLGNGEIWQFGTTVANTTSPSLTGNYAYINTSNNSNYQNADLITPTLDLSNYSENIILTFKQHFIRAVGGTATATVYYSINNGAAWTQISTFGSTSNPSTYTSSAIAALQGQSQVKFKWTYTSTASNYYWAIDDIKITGTSNTLPTVVTVPVTGVSSTSSFSGGNVTSIGTSAVTAKGVCWSTSPNPTVALTTKTSDGAGIGAYRSSITGLTPNTLYYVRAYATNTSGTSYGTQSILVAPPVAIAATSVTASSFTANWSASSEATNYSLDVSSTPFENTALYENFNGFTQVGSVTMTSSLDLYMQSSGWTGSPILENIGNAIINSSSGGYITTPSLDISGNGGNYTLYFDLNQYGGSAGKNIYITHSANGGTFNPIATVTIPGSPQTQIVQITGGSSNSKIKIASPSGGSTNRFTIDNVRIEASDMISGYTNLPVSGTFQPVTVPSTGIYYYRVRANGLNSASANSNVISTPKISITTGGNWSVPATWSPSGIPVATDDVIITAPGTVTVDVQDAVCNDLAIQSGAKLEINAGQALTVNGTLTNNANATDLLIKSDENGTGSLIAGEASGNATAERYMTTGAWHLVAPPLGGQTIENFLSENANIPLKSGNRGMMDYDPTANDWNNFFTNSSTGPLTTGRGFSLRTDADGVVNFTGTIQTGTQTLTTVAGFWNCIGNPYTSAIGITDQSIAVSKFIAYNANAGNLDPSYGAIYVWDQPDASNEQDSKYTAVSNVNTNGINDLQQGQAFFVLMKSGVSAINFTKEMQLHSPGLTLKSTGEIWPSINLEASIDQSKGSTTIAFNSNMTNGLDPTYDAGLFRSGSDIALYTLLVNDNGVPFSIQALPDNEFESLIIPVGIESYVGGDLVVSAKSFNLPANCRVILEDKVTATFTDLAKQDYHTTITANTFTSDRFLLHTSGLTTGLDNEPVQGKLQVYMDRNSEIRINGSVGRNTVAKLYDILGRTVLLHNLDEGTLNSISVSGIKTGVYLLQVGDDKKQQGFKLIIKKD